MKNFIIISFSLLFSIIYAQKIESEISIEKQEVPEIAQKFMDSLHLKKKINWYKEFNENGFSFEAKTKYNNQKYSFEFDSLGVIEDIEIKVKFKKLALELKEIIKEKLTKTFGNFKINKVQSQYKGTEKQLQNLILNGKDSELTLNYEIIIISKTNEGYKHFEVLFSQQGVLLSHKEILTPSLNHLEY